MKKPLLLLNILLASRTFAQCTLYSATIAGTSNGHCLGAPLKVSSTHAITKIVWYQGNTVVSTATATDKGLSPSFRVVAGNHGEGPALDQLYEPYDIDIDCSGNLYVADGSNSRIVKWAPGATSGVVVAGGNGPGGSPSQLNSPEGLHVDDSGNMYRKIVFNKYLKRTYDSSAAAVKSGDKQRIEYWNAEHEKASENYKAELAEWVKQPFFIHSRAAIHHSIRWNPETDTALMNQMVAIFEQKYPNEDLTRQLVNKVNATKRIAIGAIAPGFTSTDTAGRVTQCKDFRGKYTLVEFWASWCAPCREESPTLVRLYNQYKGKGLAILSVSIDKNTTQWKNAIRKDGYSWQNVCDDNGYGGPAAALYTVTAIPNSFLLDRDGRIIAKNLRGKLLEAKLAELMP